MAGLAVLLVAGLFQTQSGDLEGVSLLFPKMLIIFIACGGLFLVAKAMLAGRAAAAKADAEPVNARRVVLISIGSAVYVLLIPLLGFYPASGLFLFAMGMILGDACAGSRKKMLAAAVFTVILCVAVWLGFALLLRVPTPQSVLF